MRAAALALCLLSCGKVPLTPVNARFRIADAAWFAEESTLFLFWEVRAEQGLGEPSVIEIRYTTDDACLDWTPVDDLEAVHVHVPVDCGTDKLCGSTSLAVPLEPREVEIRLRYHEDGELALETDTAFNVVGPGAPHDHRSLVVYGVFDETNTFVQWRGRHQFPTLRNQTATRLGLRRAFTIDDTTYGTLDSDWFSLNPYGYGGSCPETFGPTEMPPLTTLARAVFHPDEVPIAAAGSPVLCASATVTDAQGAFTTAAVARRNPEVASAFPLLRSPVHDARTIPYFLAPCDRTISSEHEEMQRQRLLLGPLPTTCTDDWQQPGWYESLVVELREEVERTRVLGDDMVLVIGLHHDDDALADLLEDALDAIVPAERHRSSPRLAGAFVYDSTSHEVSLDSLAPVALWCPAELPLAELPDVSARSCPTLPDEPELDLGPLSFGTLPVFPNRDEYLEFLDDFGKRQAGEMLEQRFRVPEFAATSDHVDLGDFGVVTFLNGEAISSDADDAFSFCLPEEPAPIIARSTLMEVPVVRDAIIQGCRSGQLPPGVCEVGRTGLLPIEALPDWHDLAGEDAYELGLFWDFPFLLRLEYEARVAGSVTALGFTVPFGLGTPTEAFYGAQTWLDDEFSLTDVLTQCRRWCDHPTFDGAGVYQLGDSFWPSYAQRCYRPAFPQRGDGGFPRDP